MSPAFDGSIHEVFSTFSYGATLRLKDPKDPFMHLTLVDSAILTPTIAKVLDPNDYPSLSTVCKHLLAHHQPSADHNSRYILSVNPYHRM